MASSKGGKAGQWSARKAQLLAQRYKAAGGGYTGGKSKTQKNKGNKNNSFDISNHVFHEIAQGNHGNNEKRTVIRKTAQQVIPLDDSEVESRDFDEFNA